MLVALHRLLLSRSVATPPATASLSSAAPCRARRGAGSSKDRSFTSGVSNPHHQSIYDERRGPVTLAHRGFTVLGKTKRRKKGKSATGSALILTGGRKPSTGSLVEPRHLFPGAAEVVNPALKHRQRGSELRNDVKMTSRVADHPPNTHAFFF